MKATPAHLIAEGFRVAQFGGALTPAEYTTYLGDLLAQAGRWAAEKIGPLYAGVPADSYVNDCLIRAEVFYSASRLWKRRASFFDAGASQSLQSPAYLERREYLAHADHMMACATNALSDAAKAMGLPTDGISSEWAGVSVGVVETGQFPAVTR